MGFTVWAELARLEAFGLFFAAVEEHAGRAELPHGPLFGAGAPDLLQAARAAGFHRPSVTELRIAWRMRSIESFLAAFRDWAQLDAFPADVREAIETTVRERGAAHRSGAFLDLPNPALLLSAVE